MIEAVLKGKSLGYEYTEDILTSTIFGTLKYIRPNIGLIPFIESAILYNKERTTLWEKLNSEGIDLRCYQEVEYEFWSWNQNYGEPDLILIFKNHIHGLDDLLLVVEDKFKHGKSGTDEDDQLARYFEAINNDLENFTESSISSFKGKKGYIIYLTEAEAYSDIEATNKIIQSKHNEIKDNIFHLKWYQLYKILEKIYPYCSSFEKVIVSDLISYLEKLGLRYFSGIPLLDDSLTSKISMQYPIFFSEINKSEKKTYFDHLNNLNIELEKNIFYKGN